MENMKPCPICGSAESFHQADYDRDLVFYSCPTCGRYELTMYSSHQILKDSKVASYLFYNRFPYSTYPPEYRYHTTLSKELCDKYKEEFNSGKNTHGHPVHMDTDIIINWYPNTMAERIDRIIVKLSELTQHVGQAVKLKPEEVFALFFVDRKETDPQKISPSQEYEWRGEGQCIQEASYMIDYLKEAGLIVKEIHQWNGGECELTLTPKGYARVDEIQKYVSHGRNALVAMQFGDATGTLREAIRRGIHDAGYCAIFIDEVQHNDFITPELLKYIRDSKFVVVDLTHKNNGAYFEEGYAMGVGKPVIQLCQKDTHLHFDIAQKNTIMWEKEEDIPVMLKNRIIATID